MSTTSQIASQSVIPQDSYPRYNYRFAQGSSPEQFFEQGNLFFDKIPDNDSRKSRYIGTGPHNDGGERPGFYGNTTTFEELNAEINTFENMPLVRDAIDSFDGILEKIEMGGAFDKSRLIATSNPQGIFDFSLASQGLFRPAEYYSEELAKEQPRKFYFQYGNLKGLVPPNLVVKKQGANGLVFYFPDTKNGKPYEYLCQQRQVGVTEALDKDPLLPTKMFGDMEILVNYNKNVVFRSTNKKCYLLYDKKGGKASKVELYVVQGGLQSATSEGMLLKIMPILLAAKTLEEAGIQTRIYTVRAYTSGSNAVFMTYPIKNYGEELDWNKIALNVADPRIFRFKTWKATTGWLNELYSNIGGGSAGYGRTMQNRDLLNETFERYKNWAEQQRGMGSINQKEISRQLMFISTLDADSIQNLWNNNRQRAISIITDEFYRIMDSIDIQLGIVSKSANRISQRELPKGKSLTEIKTYINQLITDSFTLPTRGEFATSTTTIQKVLEKQQKVFDKFFEWAS